MAEASSTPAGATAITSDVNSLPIDLAASTGEKRSAAEAFEGDSVEDLKDKETTLDDVLVSPVGKKSKLLDEELPDVDDNEAFPLQEDDLDADLAIGLENGENSLDMDGETLDVAMENQDVEQGNLNMENQQDVDDLAPPEEEEESEPPTSQNNEIDIVDVDEDEEEEEEDQTYSQDAEEEEEDDDEQETARAISRAQNQREARQLLLQLDDSARSKLCLTALEKYGEELFYGHEDARDAILVDACTQDSVLSLMRDAIRVRDLYLRGSSAAAPVELDDDDDDEEEKTGGYEDEEEEEEEGEEEEDKPAGSDDDDEIVVISEEEGGEEEEEAEDSEAPNSTSFSPGSEGQAGNASHADESDEQDEEVEMEEKAQPAESDEENEEETKGDDAALGDVGAAEDSASEAHATDTLT
ncbi:hypothetical protein PRIC1_011466 [Phytophthora ramorum]